MESKALKSTRPIVFTDPALQKRILAKLQEKVHLEAALTLSDIESETIKRSAVEVKLNNPCKTEAQVKKKALKKKLFAVCTTQISDTGATVYVPTGRTVSGEKRGMDDAALKIQKLKDMLEKFKAM